MPTYAKGNRWKTDFSLNKKRYVQYFETKAEGEAWEQTLRLLIAQGRPIDALAAPRDSAMTFKQALALAFEHWRGSKNERNATSNAQDIVDYLGDTTTVRSVNKADIDSLVKYLRNRERPTSGGSNHKPLSNATINRKLAALSTMLRIAREHGEPIMVTIKQLKESEGRIRYLTHDEEATMVKLMAIHRGQALADFVTFAIETGGRLSELLAIQQRHVVKRQDGVYLTFAGVNTKSSQTRTVPLTEKAQRVLEGRLEGNPTDKVWPEHWNQHTVSHAWASMRMHMDLQGDEEFVFHACRHTCATRLLEVTGNLELVRVWLGHSDIRVTTRYAKIVNTSLLGAVASLNAQPTQR